MHWEQIGCFLFFSGDRIFSHPSQYIYIYILILNHPSIVTVNTKHRSTIEATEVTTEASLWTVLMNTEHFLKLRIPPR